MGAMQTTFQPSFESDMTNRSVATECAGLNVSDRLHIVVEIDDGGNAHVVSCDEEISRLAGPETNSTVGQPLSNILSFCCVAPEVDIWRAVALEGVLEIGVRLKFGAEQGSLMLAEVRVGNGSRAEQYGISLRSSFAKQLSEMDELRCKYAKALGIQEEFLSRMSHELRTPLNGILGFAEIIRDQHFGKGQDERYRSYADYIYNAGRDLLACIERLLELKDIDVTEGGVEEEEVPFLPSELVGEAIRDLEDVIIEKNLQVALDVTASLATLTADRSRVLKAIKSLLAEGIESLDAGATLFVHIGHNSKGDLELGVAAPVTHWHPDTIDTAFASVAGKDPYIADACKWDMFGIMLARKVMQHHGGRLEACPSVEGMPSISAIFPASRVELVNATS